MAFCDWDGEEPNELEPNSIRNDSRQLETLGLRWSDLGSCVCVCVCVCQDNAVLAHGEGDELGQLGQRRFQAVR